MMNPALLLFTGSVFKATLAKDRTYSPSSSSLALFLIFAFAFWDSLALRK
jgi:hypothetical protein